MFQRIWPILLILVSMVSVQGSASLAKSLFPILGPIGMTAWRLFFSTFLLIFIFKPWRKPIAKQALKYILAYGVSLGFMNLFFYCAIERIPIGIAVAIELTGPIMVGMLSSKKWSDYIWLFIAIVGLAMLLPIFDASDHGLSVLGVFLALGAGACWAMYIVFGRKAGQMHGSSSVALGSLAISLIMFPFASWTNGDVMFSVEVLPLAFVVALLASAIPYGLDMIALPKVPAATFSTLMSLSPVFGAISGFIFLHEKLTTYQWFAIVLIIISSIGTVLSVLQKKPKNSDEVSSAV